MAKKTKSVACQIIFESKLSFVAATKMSQIVVAITSHIEEELML